MKKILYVVVAVVAVVAVLASIILFLPKQQQPQTFSFGFENGLEDWMPDADVPQDPNRPGESVAWSIEVAGNVSFAGNKSALLYIDGLQDDGTIWLERKISTQPNAVKNVSVSFQFWSETESFNEIAVVVGYVGIENPEAEEDFEILGGANQAEGWKAYSFSSQVETDGSGDVYVALGISVRWETHMTYFIDDIAITVE